jgi:uncharacterized protein
MQCQSAPISPRSAAVSESTASASGCGPRTAAGSCNDAERRAAPVSPSSRPEASRSTAAPSRRVRPRIPRGAPQWRPEFVRPLDSQRSRPDALRVLDSETSWQGDYTEPRTETLAGDSAGASLARGPRRGNSRQGPGHSSQLLYAEERIDASLAPGTPARRPGIAAALLLSVIRIYQRTLSAAIGNVCRFEPSCSHYAYEAVERHGSLKGGVLTLRRLLRCRPLGGRGYDPVPD